MEAFQRLDAVAAPMPVPNVDTDQIIPARFLKTTSKEGLDKNLFCDWRQDPDFILNTPRGQKARKGGHIADMREAWAEACKAAGCPDLRFHDLRHHAITELAESQTSDSTIMALAGHVSRKMLEHYSHVRQDAKRDAVNLLSARRPAKPTMQGYDTNHDTSPPAVGWAFTRLIVLPVPSSAAKATKQPSANTRSKRIRVWNADILFMPR